MKRIFKRKKTGYFHPEGFTPELTPELERAVFLARIRVLERCLRELKGANERLLAENKRLIGKNMAKLFASK
jgi:hypothetical protein